MNRFITFLVLILLLSPLSAQEPVLTAEGAILMDFQTGRILFEKKAQTPHAPASMTKLITLYLGCQAVDDGMITLDTPVHVTKGGSAFSRPAGSSLMLLEEGQTLTYETLLQGIAVSSGNDGAYQLAELIGGTTEDFVSDMNLLVYSLGYNDMHFEDPDGWSELNQVSPQSYADFSRHYIEKFPWALEKMHSLPTLTYPGPENLAPQGLITTSRTKKNTNILLGKIPGIDGLKTGYIDESGFNFTATAKREDTRFIAVVMGIFTNDYVAGLKLRAQESASLLEYGFDNWNTQLLPDLSVPVKVYKGELEQVRLIPLERPLYTLSQDELARVESVTTTKPWLEAPLEQGIEAGKVEWYYDGDMIGESPLISSVELKKGSFFHNFIDLFEILIYNVSHKEA